MSFPTRFLFGFAVLAGCGGSAETSAPPSTEDSKLIDDGQGAGMSSVTGTTDAQGLDEPRKLSDLPTNGETVLLHLYVSNQSFDISPVAIDVWLEDTHVITGGFDVEGQHNWILFDLNVPIGSHGLRAEYRESSVVLTETISIPAERWGVLEFWYYPNEPEHPMFTWSLHDSPVAFN